MVHDMQGKLIHRLAAVLASEHEGVHQTLGATVPISSRRANRWQQQRWRHHHYDSGSRGVRIGDGGP